MTIQLEAADRPAVRLWTRGKGTLAGEIGLYPGSPAPVSVVADQPSTIYCLSAEDLKRMEESEPEVAAALHKFVAQHLSERLAGTTRTLEALLE